MEGDPVSLPTPSGSGSGSSVRKERGAIAAQACDTCRARKQKCDEQRPKCGTCLRFKLECHYREPQPTKKDKTLVEILERIKALEGKIDKYHLAGGYPRTSFTPLPPLLTSAPMTATPDQMGALPATPFNVPESASAGSATEDHYRYASSVHQLFEWPVIQRLLEVVNLDSTSIGLKPAEREGPAPLQGLVDNQELPKHTALDALASVHRLPTIPRSMPISMPALTWDTMQQLSKAYFDSFNFLYPILDRQLFTSELMLTVFNDGFSDGIASVLAFLVFALGEVAIAGTQAMPIHMYNGRPSGFRGGTREEPPGLSLFNEARKRMGFNLTECSLENVQVFALASLYYGTCCHHTEFWRMTISASLACQALIASNPSEMSSSRADLIRRAFWHCSIMETCLNLELGLPLTGLGKMETLIGLPDFSGSFSQDDYLGNEGSHFQEHFASQIVLRRLLVGFHTSLNNSPAASPILGSSSPPAAISQNTISQMDLQLEQWLGMLPVYLRWPPESPGDFPGQVPSVYPTDATIGTFPGALPSGPSIAQSATAASAMMFTTDLDTPITTYPFAVDIQVALLRSRYYYTKHLIHRPFVYKALHHMDSLTNEDCLGVAECLKASLKWPITMSPPSKRKRLIPCLFFWSRNLLGILVLLHLSQTVPILLKIRNTLCGDRFDLDADESVGLYIDWLRDVKSVDRSADWCWNVVKTLYHLEDSP